MRRLVAAASLVLALTACERWIYVPDRGVVEKAAVEWTMDGGNSARQASHRAAPKVDLNEGRRSVSALQSDPRSRSGEAVSPLVIGDKVVFGTGARAVGAVRWDGGDLLWRHPMRGGVVSSPAYSDGVAFFADDVGWVEAIGMDGRRKWEFRMPAYVAAPLVIDGQKLFVLSADQNLYCLDVETGRPLWRYEKQHDREGTIWRASSPAVSDGRLFLGLSNGEVVALDADFGRVLWKRDLSTKAAMPDVTCGPAVENGVVYVGSLEGPFAALKAATGEVIWSHPYKAAGSVAIGQEHVYFGNIAGELVAARKTDGETAWKVKLDGGIPAPPVVAGERVFVGATLGSFYEINGANGAVLQTWSPATGIQARPWVGELGVAVISNSGMLHLFNGRR